MFYNCWVHIYNLSNRSNEYFMTIALRFMNIPNLFKQSVATKITKKSSRNQIEDVHHISTLPWVIIDYMKPLSNEISQKILFEEVVLFLVCERRYLLFLGYYASPNNFLFFLVKNMEFFFYIGWKYIICIHLNCGELEDGLFSVTNQNFWRRITKNQCDM